MRVFYFGNQPDRHSDRRIVLINILIRIVILTIGVAAAAYMLPGIDAQGWEPVLKAALLLAVINALVKPVLFLLTLPITILTLGIFTFILNGLILWFVGTVISGFEIDGFFSAVLGSIIISIISIVLNRAV